MHEFSHLIVSSRLAPYRQLRCLPGYLPQFLMLFLLMSGMCCLGQALKAQESAVPGNYTPAVPLITKPPSYPVHAASRSEEAWVQLYFMVLTDGTVDHIMLAESNGREPFEKEAIRATQGFIFSPAEEDGIPVIEKSSSVFTFLMHSGVQGVGKQFTRQYKNIQKQIAKGKLKPARRSLDQLISGRRNSLYEDAWAWWLNYQFLEAEGLASDAEKIESLRRTFYVYEDGDKLSKHPNLDTQFLMLAMERLFTLQAKSGQYQNALDTYKYLEELNPGTFAARQAEILARLRPEQQKIIALRESDSTLQMTGRLSRQGYIIHPLTHPEFTIKAENDELFESVEIRCANHFENYPYLPDEKWLIQDSWKNCDVYLKGTPYTAVAIHEFPG